MDHVVTKLSEIENAAVAIVNNTEIQKQEYTKKIKEDQAIFDAKLSEITSNTISGIKAEAESNLTSELTKMNENNELALKAFQAEYDEHFESYAEQIIKNITEV